MPVTPARLEYDLKTIAKATATPGEGASRPTFSAAWAQAVEYVVGQARACGCQVRIDAGGNVHLRSAATATPVWLSGSHLDSVPHGGDFDGVLGVLAPLEVLRAAHEDDTDLPLELVIFAEEEGTTFGLGMLGSQAWTGRVDAQRLGCLRNESGRSYLESGAAYGVAPSRLEEDRLKAGDYRGFIELHIEQGPGLWKDGQPLALVTAINGRRQYNVALGGVANHAGATSMGDRRDALAGAAETIAAVEALPARLGPQAVATVGRIECQPNAVNVIASHVTFTIDLRAPRDEQLEQGDRELKRQLAAIAERRGLTLALEASEQLAATALDPAVCERLNAAAEAIGCTLPATASGALHDAAIVAPHVPTAMLFVASRDGISHNPAEFSRLEDIVLATRVLYGAVAGEGAAP
jgi:allantoate deiminase